MKQKIIQIPILILLVLLNITLMVIYAGEQAKKTRVSTRELERVIELYEDAGITFKVVPSARLSQQESLQLQSADLDAVVLEYLNGESYDLTYIYGAKTQYNTETEVLIADWDNHMISYRNTTVEIDETEEPWKVILSEEEQLMLETVAMQFAEKWLGESVIVTGWQRSGGTLSVTFAQMAEDTVYYFNTITVVVVRQGIESAELTYWRVKGDTETVEAMPIDEVMVLGLEKIREAGIKSDEVTSLIGGYSILSTSGDSAIAMPNLSIVLESGRMFTVDYCYSR